MKYLQLMVFGHTFLFLLLPFTGWTQNDAPMIRTIEPSSTIAEQYDKFEVRIDLSASYTNPYDYDQIVVSGVFRGPDGQSKRIDGFYMKEFDLDTSNGQLRPAQDPGVFKIRFAPDQIGEWSYTVVVEDMNGVVSSEATVFRCIPPTNPKNKGFVRSDLTNYLHFDTDEQYVPIGENMAWPVNNPYLDYQSWLNGLSENGGNFFRLWHAHWGLGIEWQQGWNGFEGLRKYQQTNARYQDWLFDYCAANGIHVMLTLQHHGQVSSQVNPNWGENPYNARNDGPCIDTWDFFVNEEAMNHTRNRFRYIIARWGYSRAIMAWELFNEVEWTDEFEKSQSKVQDWHFTMAAYLKEIDPNNHLVTTSFAHENYDPLIWNNPDIDITQTHFYLNTSNIERALAGGVRNYLDAYGKPTLTGEFGLGASSRLSEEDTEGIHLHNGLWGALFAGGMGTAMSWWWDSYIHPSNLYYHFSGLSTVTKDIPLQKSNMVPATSYTIGMPGDLSLIPTMGWGIVGDSLVRIGTNQSFTPTKPSLGIFLYGAEWNAEFRSPPTFDVIFPQDGAFTVETSTATGKEPKIAIWLDGEKVLEEAADINQTYEIDVPAGRHTITVDNPGTDWISIAAYGFLGAGSQVDSYVLLSEGKEIAAGWLLNHRYNHKYLSEKGEPTPAIDGELVIEGFSDGNYFLTWYDCLSGEIVGSEIVTAMNRQLSVSIPDLYWDLSFLIGGSDVVRVEDAKTQMTLNLYPNPVGPGESIQVTTNLGSNESGIVSLLDASGRVVKNQQLWEFPDGAPLTFQLPRGLTSGLYWLRVLTSDQWGSKPLFVGK